ncbi:MAG: OmpA family protein [Bacteroidales bacterium]|nr:OmpA family protein [Bacteroidales bacterium]
MRALHLVIVLGLFTAICHSQTDLVRYDMTNIYIEKGDYYASKKDFKKAIVYYNLAFNRDNNYEALLKKAETYTSMKFYDHAAECYRIVFKSEFKVPNEYRLKYAFLLLENKDIRGFEKWLAEYNKEVYSEIYDYTSGTEVRKRLYIDTTYVIVENEGVLNTYESEICPALYKDRVLFASTRKNLAGDQGNDDYTLYSAIRLNNGQLGKLNIFNRSLNSSENESSVCIPDFAKNMYITRSTARNANLKTYISNIPASITDKSDLKEFTIEGFSSIGQIAFNSNGTKMYFTSNSPGGNGGLDIYSSDYINNKWDTPQNLGSKINSGKDEMYPFILNDTILYFTSDGHNGLGGLDLYYVNLNQKNSSPVNLGNKVNSAYDDFCLVFSPSGLTGYFSSNRPGGFGKEDIYRLHLLSLKIKNPALQPKKRYYEPRKIALYLSDGEEYDIASKDNAGFNFGFLPQEAYKMVIRHEDPLATNVIDNDELSEEQREKAFLNPKPLERTDIELQSGMKYQFTVGMNPISHEYLNELNDMSKDYQNKNADIIDLTALAKELLLAEGEVYTIRFIKDVNQPAEPKTKEITTLAVNDQTVPVSGRSFFIVLPLDIEVNFNVQTDIGYFKETYNPKKVGEVRVDTDPVQEVEPIIEAGFPILVNTESLNEAPNKLLAREFSVIPGTFYMLSLSKSFPGTDKKLEVFVPLTKGVKYNIGSDVMNSNEYNQEVVEMIKEQAKNEVEDEERIDISILSKELDITAQDSVIFSLMPVKRKGAQASDANNVPTVLEVDGKKYSITSNDKLRIMLTLDENKMANIRTDLSFVKENFEPSTIALKVDNTTISEDVAEESKNIITDPVFDVIVVNFNLNEYSIRDDARSILENKVVNALKGDNRLYVTIKGYTDPLGNAAYNEKLSENRAVSVKDFLVSNGIGENRIRTFSFGAEISLQDGQNWEDMSQEELQQYRKVEIVIYLPK